MKKLTILLVSLLSVVGYTQHNISGNFTPAEDFSWLIAYRLKAGTQVYVVDTSIKNGEFVLKLPENAIAGTYRLVYAIPQEEFYFDVIYNGKEDIQLAFNADQGVQFFSSKENILFDSYFKMMNDVEQRLVKQYSDGAIDTLAYRNILKEYQNIQKTYERKTQGLIANSFISSNRAYAPKDIESIQDFVSNRKASYFKHIDVENSMLQASGFLTNKIANYVFTSLPLEEVSKKETEKAMKGNIEDVIVKLAGTSEAYKFHILYTLWTQSSASNFNSVADYIFNTYLRKSVEADKNNEIISNIEIYNRLRIGANAPEISWKEGKVQKKLSTLKGYENYVLVFWSSTCGHCLKELPSLHQSFKENTKVKVIAIGLENDELNWKLESEKITDFKHVISLGKWDSPYAKLYNIQATPTYFVLDAKKQIIAKPETYTGVTELLKS